MTALSAGMTREQAAELLAAHNKDPFHIEHGETVEQTMRYFAREYDPENEEFWGIVGLLHDLDWEEAIFNRVCPELVAVTFLAICSTAWRRWKGSS